MGRPEGSEPAKSIRIDNVPNLELVPCVGDKKDVLEMIERHEEHRKWCVFRLYFLDLRDPKLITLDVN